MMASDSWKLSAVLLFVAIFRLAHSQQRCSRPSTGTCIEPRQCQQIVSYLSNDDISRSDKISFLERHKTCSQAYLICCPSANSNSAPPRPTVSQPISSVSNLLPSRDECGKFKDDKIFRGVVADIYEQPWAVLLQYRKGSSRDFQCGGTLISKRYVITAGHCLDAKLLDGWSLLNVRLGETDTKTSTECARTTNKCNNPPVDVAIDEKIVHEDYSVSSNDIALLRLSRNIQFTDFIIPVCLPNPSIAEEVGDYYKRQPTAVGWGLINFAMNSTWKMIGIMEVVDNAECHNKISRLSETITDRHLCAGTTGSLTCSGDSGGGLNLKNAFNNWVQIGIISFGHRNCGRQGFPSVFTRVSSYMDWITSKMRA